MGQYFCRHLNQKRSHIQRDLQGHASHPSPGMRHCPDTQGAGFHFWPQYWLQGDTTIHHIWRSGLHAVHSSQVIEVAPNERTHHCGRPFAPCTQSSRMNPRLWGSRPRCSDCGTRIARCTGHGHIHLKEVQIPDNKSTAIAVLDAGGAQSGTTAGAIQTHASVNCGFHTVVGTNRSGGSHHAQRQPQVQVEGQDPHVDVKRPEARAEAGQRWKHCHAAGLAHRQRAGPG